MRNRMRVCMILTAIFTFMILSACLSGNDGQSNSNSDSSNSLSLTSRIEATLTPQGATVTLSVDGLLAMESNQSVSELTSFYKEALKNLEAKEISVSEIIGTWKYLGTLSNGKNISILITIEGDKSFIDIYIT